MQILINLVGNAFKFTSTGKISIETSNQYSVENNGTLLFEVQDSGIGISEDGCSKLFQRFSQVHDTVDSSYRGTGLGLAICSQIVHLMGGEIGVKSELGKGTTFWFTVDLQQDTGSQGLKDDEGIHRHVENKRVLLVEVDSVLNHYFLRLGESWRVQMHSANTLVCARTKLNEISIDYDLVIVDLDVSANHPDEEVMQLLDLILVKDIPLFTLSAMNADNGALVNRETCTHFPKAIIPYSLKEQMARRFSYRASSVAESADNSFALSALIVDDNSVNCMVAKGMLESLGVSCDVTTDSQRALGILSQRHSTYDLVFMDCEMPVMDGFEVTRKVREIERSQLFKANCIVALTAHVLPEYQLQAKQAGMNDFISKPLQKNQLLQLLIRSSVQPLMAALPEQADVALQPLAGK